MEENPYRAPSFDEMSANQDELSFGLSASNLTEAEIRAFVGKKADYYLARWSSALHHGGGRAGFNWAAFFLTGLWIPYRKMYRAAGILFGIVTVESIFEEFLPDVRLLQTLGRISGLAVPIVCGMYANAWYLAHTKREVARVRALDLDEGAFYETLSRRGGTSLLASCGLFLFFVLVGTLVVPIVVEILNSGN